MTLWSILFIAIALQADSHSERSSSGSRASVEVQSKAIKLIDVSGARDRLMTSFPAIVEQGKAAMRNQCPKCDPAFISEWGKRMMVRLKIDDFVHVAAEAYEKHFTSDELTQLTTFVTSQKAGTPSPLAPALQKKYSDLLPTIMGEIVGGCTELGGKLGRDVGTEIEREHPEYFPNSKSAKTQP